VKKIYEDSWFQVGRIREGIYMISEPHHFQEVKSYLVVGEHRAALIDTGMGIGNIKAIAEKLTDREIIVINTHSHFDHIGDNWRFGEIAIHKNEAEIIEKGVKNVFSGEMAKENKWGRFPEGFDVNAYSITPSKATMLLEEGSLINLGGARLKVLHTPGHSPGSICLLDESRRMLYTGDTIYEGTLYAYFSDSDIRDYARSVRRLCYLYERLDLVLPAHNEVPLKPKFLCTVAEAFEKLISGKVKTLPNDGLSEASFGDFSILFR
jgi:glyoxylase-like metal-dependent hydrolase (beta-lactamase superfamily II)